MRLSHLVSDLRRDASGIALTEFAIAFPVLLALGLYGIDTANLALTHLKLNQIALNLADNASRVGVNSTLSTQQMREIDVNDIFQGAKTQGASLNLTTNARIILSSLEKDSSGTQRIHWQRCIGLKSGATYDSHYGTTLVADGTTSTGNAGTAAATGMGDTGFKVNAPGNNSGVMFVEINYRYTPMFGWLSAPADLRYTASFVVRDPRDFTMIYNPSPTATRSTCNLYAS
jgi:Flp pilus assembly protein TadG